MSDSCKTRETLPRNVTITYASLQVLLFIVISIWCIQTVKKYTKWENGNLCQKIKVYFQEIKNKRKMIFPLLSFIQPIKTVHRMHTLQF